MREGATSPFLQEGKITADFDWQDKRLAHLTQINVADTLFFLFLWEINNPITLLDLDNSAYGVKVEAFPDYPQRITSYKDCKKGLVFCWLSLCRKRKQSNFSE